MKYRQCFKRLFRNLLISNRNKTTIYMYVLVKVSYSIRLIGLFGLFVCLFVCLKQYLVITCKYVHLFGLIMLLLSCYYN